MIFSPRLDSAFTVIARRLNGFLAEILRCFSLQSVRIAAKNLLVYRQEISSIQHTLTMKAESAACVSPNTPQDPYPISDLLPGGYGSCGLCFLGQTGGCRQKCGGAERLRDRSRPAKSGITLVIRPERCYTEPETCGSSQEGKGAHTNFYGGRLAVINRKNRP